MESRSIGLKGMCLAAVVALLAACETAPEDTGSQTDQGQAQQQATTGPASTATTAPPAAAGPAPGTQEDLDLNVGSLVFFDFDKFDLKPDARATVERWAAWLQQNPQATVTVQGHCDERGTREYNLGLGERRSTSARNYLIALGVNPDRIGTISYGKERPVCGEHNEGCWSQNRRAMLAVN